MSLSRRNFLIGSGIVGGGLIIGFGLSDSPTFPHSVAGSFQPNAWLQITEDGRVIFQLHKVEMGQGVMTGLPTILGEELDFNPERFEIEMSGIHSDFMDPVNRNQMTGGSTSIKGSWDTLREAGAIARSLLISAAATRWGISPDLCSTNDGVISNSNNSQTLSYADVAMAARTASPIGYTLKSASEYRWIGKTGTRLDSIAKSTGKAKFGIDVSLPNMKIAAIVRCPHFGGSVKSWDGTIAEQQAGVLAVFKMHSGIAVVADSYWQAKKAAEQLTIEWDKGPLAGLNSAMILQQQQNALATGKSHEVKSEGDKLQQVLSTSEIILEAEYASPYTHHSPMEPQNTTALVTKDHCEVWSPNQAPDICRALAAQHAELPQANITINTTLLGGGFGRRGYPDFVSEAVAIAKQMFGIPIKVIWSREDDMQHDYYRAANYHGIKAAIDKQGTLVGWEHKIVSGSIVEGLSVELAAIMLPTWVPSAIAKSLGKFAGEQAAPYDITTAEGAKIPYQIANLSVSQIYYDAGIQSGFWRSVGYSHNCFVVESFIDEVANATQQDPLLLRQKMLDPQSRHATVLALAAEKAGWGNPFNGLSQGLAVVDPFSSYCAMVAEVSVDGTDFKIERIVAAVDCGLVINPDIVRTQVEGAIIYALTAAIKPPVTIEDGRVVESNFHDLPVIRMNETPTIEVHIISSAERPTGIGEIGVPAVAPAIANALFAATGQRLRQMPLRLS